MHHSCHPTAARLSSIADDGPSFYADTKASEIEFGRQLAMDLAGADARVEWVQGDLFTVAFGQANGLEHGFPSI
jgi:hypothetical protein